MFKVIEVEDKYYIDGLVNVNFAEDVVVPSTIDDKPIYGISSNAFNKRTVRKVTIEDGIEYIADNAFEGCQHLLSVEIPKSVSYIGEYAFEGCEKLHTVVFKEESKLTTLAKGLFANCEKLESIVLPDGLVTIGEWCFFQCENLINIQMPKTVTTISEFAFAKCFKLMNLLFEKDTELQIVKDFAFMDDCKLVVCLPKTVAEVGKGSFQNVFKVQLEPDNKLENIPYLRSFKGCDLYK